MPNIPNNESTTNTDYFENKPIELEPPRLSEVEWERFPQSYFWIAGLWQLIFLAFVSVVFLLYSFFGDAKMELYAYKDLIFLGILALQLIRIVHLWFAIKKRGFALREHDLVYTSGVFFRSVMVLPFIRIQHTEIGENPVLNWQNLCNLKLLTAAHSDLQLTGIEKPKAQFLRQYIHQYLKNRNGNT